MENKTKETITFNRRRVLAIVGIMVGILAISTVLFMMMVHSLAKSDEVKSVQDMPKAYTYDKATAINGMELHVLKTKPSNVSLTAVHNNVPLTSFYGINGGFFYEEALLSIAVVNSLPVNGAIGEYGSGASNAKYARGTLVWDGASDQLSVQIAGDATALKVRDHTRFWAQGGISMSIGSDEGWQAQAMAENAPYPDDARLRSAAVYDKNGMLYLVVSANKGTLAAFREAIMERVGDGQLVDGIFLDGDGSSQLSSTEAKLTGDNRPVVQMMRIMK